MVDREREILEFDLREKVFRELLARSNTEVAFLSFGGTEVRTSKKVVEAWFCDSIPSVARRRKISSRRSSLRGWRGVQA